MEIINEAQAHKKIIESLGRFAREADNNNIQGLAMVAITSEGRCLLAQECSLLPNSMELSVGLGKLFVEINTKFGAQN